MGRNACRGSEGGNRRGQGCLHTEQVWPLRGGRREEHQGRGAQSEVRLESLSQPGGALQPALPHAPQEGLRPPQRESSQRRRDKWPVHLWGNNQLLW